MATCLDDHPARSSTPTGFRAISSLSPRSVRLRYASYPSISTLMVTLTFSVVRGFHPNSPQAAEVGFQLKVTIANFLKKKCTVRFSLKLQPGSASPLLSPATEIPSVVFAPRPVDISLALSLDLVSWRVLYMLQYVLHPQASASSSLACQTFTFQLFSRDRA